MKSIVVYSSLTGNTKMVGEAIAEVLPPQPGWRARDWCAAPYR